MKPKRAISPKFLRGLKGLRKAERERLALRGIREADQLACLLHSQPELVAQYTSTDAKLTSVWGDSSVRRIHVEPVELTRQIKAHSRSFGAVRRPRKNPDQVALRPNAISQLLGLQLEQHGGLPAEVDMTASIPYIHDQGVNPACVGHAATAAVEMHTGDVLSGSYVYLHSKALDGHPHEDGTTLEAGIEALSQFGACKLATWPGADAEMRSLDGLGLPDEAADEEASGFGISAARSGPIDTIHGIKTALAYGTAGQGRPVLAAVPVYASWDAAFRTGTVSLRLGEDDTLLGWHAILLVGYRDDHEAPGGGHFLFQNSWGEGWASASPHRDGVGSIPYAYFEENETETHYLEPAVLNSANVVVGMASRYTALVPIVGFMALCGLFLWPFGLAHPHASTLSEVSTPQRQDLARPLRLPSDPRTVSSSLAIPSDTWETLDAEHKLLDHDLAEYVSVVHKDFPEGKAVFRTKSRSTYAK
ncbi:hypothetical protein Verru16b_03225 [Lacunisphaera limnophila]|uniref:Papain family cysteine protease n=1 Tax=Lacunisphaera limnophila TaxID=1838286 RepID=A0A1D8AZ19_9BACT|nr:C1 family peptidase [Lacunisphaera limnophila]AOS46129.1 hypothetical protein Verru16b_03225 [Lacunisphaera limnophila]